MPINQHFMVAVRVAFFNKMPSFKSILILFFSFLLLNFCEGQNLSPKKALNAANKFFKNENYEEAYKYFKKYQKTERLNTKTAASLGIVSYHTNRLEEAKLYFDYVEKLGKYKKSILFFYKAKTLMHEGNFKEAIIEFKNYLRVGKLKLHQKKQVYDLIRNCSYSLKNRTIISDAIIQSIGTTVNTKQDELLPILSPNYEDVIYFSAIRNSNVGGKRSDLGIEMKEGKYHLDIFKSQLSGGLWQEPIPMSSLINTPKDDIVIDFSSDGKILYLFSGLNTHCGQILVDTFKESSSDKRLFPNIFDGAVFAEKCDVDLSFLNDGNSIIFASRELGGFGGYDLFVIRKNEDGSFSEPINLGENINSQYDERYPFLAKDGRTLYYSSNNIEKSFGGFDVYKTVFNDDLKVFPIALSLGFGINSTGDDIGFKLNKEGTIGFLSSNRKEAVGGFDIFLVYFKKTQFEQTRISNPPFFTSLINYEVNYLDHPKVEFVEQKTVSDEPQTIDLPQYVFINNKLPVYFGKNQTILDEWGDFLLINPDRVVTLFGFNNEKTPNYVVDLFTSYDPAEKVANYLLKKGVNTSQINIIGCGNSYSLVGINEKGNPLTNKLNNRVAFILDSRGTNLTINYKANNLTNRLTGINEGTIFLKRQKGFTYRVEVISTNQLFNDPIIVSFPDALLEKNKNEDQFHYTLGIYNKIERAQKILVKLKEKGFYGAKIINYSNGNRLRE